VDLRPRVPWLRALSGSAPRLRTRTVGVIEERDPEDHLDLKALPRTITCSSNRVPLS
jgi:hypothetical protein